MIRLKVTPVVGLPQFTGWSQVAESTSSSNTRLVSVFAISGKHAGNVGRDVSDKISDFYYYDVEQLHEFIQGLVDLVKENDCELFISCALINGDKSVFVTRGGSVFLKRKEKIGKILFSEDQIKIVSGTYTGSDVFVLTTLQASQFLNEIEQKFSQGFDVDIIITSVVPGLHAQTDSSLSAIVFINQVIEKEESISSEINSRDKKDIEEQGIDLEITANLPKNLSKNLSITMLFSKKLFSFLLVLKTKVFKRISILMKSFFRKGFSSIKRFSIKRILSKIKSIKSGGLTSILQRLKSVFGKKLVITVFIFLIISGVASVVFIKSKKEAERVNSLLGPIQEKLVVAREQLDGDPISSRDLTLEAINSLETLKKENSESRAVDLIEEELKKTSIFYDEISGKKELDELDIFYDLRLVKSDYIASDLDVNSERLVLLDSEKKQVVVLDVSTKKVDVRDFSDYEDARDLVLSDNKVFILSDGIKSFELEEDSEVNEVRGLGDSNRNATFVSAYDRFVYVLSPDKLNIYRYSKDEDGYSDPIGWMKSETGVKYNEITSFSVDGDIWLSTIDGQIKKFTSGREESFSTRGLSEEFSSNIKIFTNINQENIYVLEADKNRVVILSKTGEFKREIKSVSLSTVGSIAVSEELGKIFAVSGSIVFEIDLAE